MSYPQLQAVILAAGKSSRFNTSQSKLVHTICGLEMIVYPVSLVAKFTDSISLVVGYQKEYLKEILDKHSFPITYTEQTIQAGTGHALLCTQSDWSKEHILVMNGDMPLVTTAIIEELVQTHLDTQAVMSFITAHCNEPENHYGKVVIEKGKVSIIEAKNFIATSATEETSCINAGIYLFKRSFLEETLNKITQDTLTKEIYITDLAGYASELGLTVTTVPAPFDTIRGVNTLKELWAVEHIKRSELINHFMNNGVRFEAAQHVILDYNVHIEPDACIGAGVILRAGTTIGKNSSIDAFSVLSNVQVGDNVSICSHSSLSNCIIKDHALIGPYARVHQQSVVHESAIVGNFVEVSKSTIGQKSKTKHLTYLGQTTVGQNVNIGAGTITCNYNGVNKHTTDIKDNAFIGSNSCLIAPVIIGNNSIVAAGSTITQPVPDNALAIARERQTNKEEYAAKLKQKYVASKKSPIVTL